MMRIANACHSVYTTTDAMNRPVSSLAGLFILMSEQEMRLHRVIVL